VVGVEVAGRARTCTPDPVSRLGRSKQPRGSVVRRPRPLLAT